MNAFLFGFGVYQYSPIIEVEQDLFDLVGKHLRFDQLGLFCDLTAIIPQFLRNKE